MTARLYVSIDRSGLTPRYIASPHMHPGAREWIPRDAVRVKPLEWKEYHEEGFWRADTPIGEYSVGFDDGWWAQLEGVEFWEWEAPEDPRCYLGPEAGMIACKADYEARILSALAALPAGAQEEG